jgi:hypothetical protein
MGFIGPMVNGAFGITPHFPVRRLSFLSSGAAPFPAAD